MFPCVPQLGDAILLSSQTGAELNLQQKLRQDAQLRLEELEETLLEKDQELQRLQAIVVRQQGEVRRHTWTLHTWTLHTWTLHLCLPGCLPVQVSGKVFTWVFTCAGVR